MVNSLFRVILKISNDVIIFIICLGWIGSYNKFDKKWRGEGIGDFFRNLSLIIPLINVWKNKNWRKYTNQIVKCM